MVEAFKMKDLLEAGVHFGHQLRRWNPKMKKYIYAERGGIHIINLQQTIGYANQTYEIIRDMAKEGKKILFVCTKKQGNISVKEAAISCGMPYISKRWLGGILTNSESVKNSIRKLRRFERMENDGSLDKLTKKEKAQILKKKDKIENLLGGLKEMDKLPDALFVIDTVREKNALLEAKRFNIPVIAIIDTNSDPDLVTYPVPANDDAIRAVKFFASKFAEAINEGLSLSSQEGISTSQETETLDNDEEIGLKNELNEQEENNTEESK